jgi:hypothetical protein
MKKLIPILILSLSGCAKNAVDVQPVSVPGYEYERMSCNDLTREHARSLEYMSTLVMAQEAAARDDNMATFIVGVPVSPLTGADKSESLAVAKGRDLTIRSIMKAKSCSL